MQSYEVRFFFDTVAESEKSLSVEGISLDYCSI